MNTLRQQLNISMRPSSTPVLSGLLQRKCACGNHTVAGGQCEECRMERENGLTVQRLLAIADRRQANEGEIPPIVHEVLRSPGQSLDPATRAFMEPRFGHDFSKVRVHADAKAAESARVMNAQAYTVGREIVFYDYQYAPRTFQGARLLGHELTHDIQQDQAKHSGPLALASDRLEYSAQRAERQIMSGEPIAVQDHGSHAIARKPLSLKETLNQGTLSDEELQQEINEIRQWLKQNQASSVEGEQLAATLGTLGHELLHRHPDIGPGTSPVVLGLVTAAQIAQAELAFEAPMPAPAALPAAAPAPAATPPPVGVGIGVGAAFAAVAAFLVVLFWSKTSIVSGREEQRMLEESRRLQQQTQPKTKEPLEYCGNSGSGFCNNKNKQRCSYTCEDGHSFDIYIYCPIRGKQVNCPKEAWRQ
jgi:hypothetical protein